MPIFKLSIVIILAFRLISNLRRPKVSVPTIQTIGELDFVQAAAVAVMSQERPVVVDIFSFLSKADGARLMKAITSLPQVEVGAQREVRLYLAAKLRLPESELTTFATHHPQIVAVEMECWLGEVAHSPRGTGTRARIPLEAAS